MKKGREISPETMDLLNENSYHIMAKTDILSKMLEPANKRRLSLKKSSPANTERITLNIGGQR